MWEKIIFGIVLLHLIAGFGWAIYKMEFQRNKPSQKIEKITIFESIICHTKVIPELLRLKGNI